METAVFPGRFESLSRVSQFVVRAAQAAGLNPKAIYAVELAVDEACSNIIDHAYGGEGIGDMECSVATTDEGLLITLRDFGRPFDPALVPDPQINVPIDKLRSRGVGLFLIRKMMDRVEYRASTEHGNVLTMLKRKQN